MKSSSKEKLAKTFFVSVLWALTDSFYFTLHKTNFTKKKSQSQTFDIKQNQKFFFAQGERKKITLTKRYVNSKQVH